MYMIAFVKISLKDGISKKILAQAAALSKKVGACTLLCLNEDSCFQKIVFNKDKMQVPQIGDKIVINFASFGRVDPFIRKVDAELDGINDPLYIRHMVPSIKYVSFLRKYKRNKIIYEIPTYPYYYEQITASTNKILTIARLVQESLFWPLIYNQVKKIVAIPCRSTAKKYRKMQYITNGYSSNGTFSRYERDKDEIVLIGVGTIQKYHGYDKIIEMIHVTSSRNIRFIIVGGGEVDPLKKLVEKYNLQEQVVFTGPKGGEELEALYRQADIGVGTMALELRKADIDTGIKILDYYIHGLPVLSSGKCPDVDGLDNPPYRIIDDYTNATPIYQINKCFDEASREKLSRNSASLYSWDSIMERAING